MTRNTDRIVAIGWQDGLLYALLPALISLATSAKALPGVFAGGLIDPDSYMRLVRIQEGAGYVVERDASGAGTLLHWSHLLDMLLVLLAAPFRLFMGADAALHAGAVMLGPLGMAALGFALAWAVAPFVDRQWLWLAPVTAALSSAIASYGMPGVAHHHVLLVVVAVMTTGYAARGALDVPRAGDGLAMGAWAGVGIWLSPETMPLTLMAFGFLWLARRNIIDVAFAFLLVVVAAFLVDPPYAGYGSVEIDRISVVYVALACATALVALLRQHGVTRVISVIPFVLWIALFPSIALGPDGLMPAHDTHALMDGIVEMMPVHGAAQAIQYLLTGSLTALLLAWFAASTRSLLLGYVAACAVVLVILAAMHVRFAAYPAVAAAAMLPVLVSRCTSAFQGPTAQAAMRVALMALFILLPGGIVLPQAAQAAAREPAQSCSLADGATLLTSHAGQIVLANPNDSPELLYRTRVLTVGSLYHRNVAAYLRLRAAWRSPPSDSVPATLRATGATLVLFCHTPARSLLLADAPNNTLLDRLNQDDVPPWLHKIGEDSRSGTLLYEVLP